MAPDATEIIAEGENSDPEEDAEPGKFSDLFRSAHVDRNTSSGRGSNDLIHNVAEGKSRGRI